MSIESATRLEAVAEATESLFSALFNARGTTGEAARAAFDEVSEAREAYRAALAEFIMPVMRVVEGGVAGQENIGDDTFVCRKCKAKSRCCVACPDWHQSIVDATNTADETFPTCPVCDLPADPSMACFERHCPRKGHA